MSVGKSVPVAAIIVNDGETNQPIGNFTGIAVGSGLVPSDRGQLLNLEAENEGYDTIHFRTGQMSAGNLVLATPGTPSAASMAFFGQLNIPYPKTIRAIHLHLIDTGTSGHLTVEVYRRRSGTFTLLATLDLTEADGDFAINVANPSGDLASLEAGDYLYCQPTAKDLVTNGANGMTVDVHFSPRH